MAPTIGDITGVLPVDELPLTYSPDGYENLSLPHRRNYWEDFSEAEETIAVSAYLNQNVENLAATIRAHADKQENDSLFPILVGASQNPKFLVFEEAYNTVYRCDFALIIKLMETQIEWSVEALTWFFAMLEEQTESSHGWLSKTETQAFGAYQHWTSANCHLLVEHLDPKNAAARTLYQAYLKNPYISEEIRVMVSLLIPEGTRWGYRIDEI